MPKAGRAWRANGCGSNNCSICCSYGGSSTGDCGGSDAAVFFARVFLADPGLVILDEASSRLDPATERLIERATDRLLTNRIVFKIHELEHLIGTIARRCRGQVVYLLRHPVPTTLSRQVFPRLELLMRSAFYNEAIPDQSRVREIRRLGESGSHLQRGIVSWCYENVTALRQAAERRGLDDFSPLWAGQHLSGCRPEPAAAITRELAAGWQ